MSKIRIQESYICLIIININNNKVSIQNFLRQMINLDTNSIPQIVDDAQFCNNSIVSKTKKEVSYRRWTKQQNIIYANFLKDNLASFQTEFDRRKTKVFLRMSELLHGKDQHKCRSHHQKMIKFCGNIENVIKKFLQITIQLEEIKAKDSQQTSRSEFSAQERELQINNSIRQQVMELNVEESIFQVLNLGSYEMGSPLVNDFFF